MNDFKKYYDEIIRIYAELGYSADIIGQWTLPQRDAQTLLRIIQVSQPHNILEVGTFVGLATLLMALVSAPETHIHTVDPNFPLQVEMGAMKSRLDDIDTSIRAQDLAFQAAQRLGVEKKITFHAGGFSTANTFASYNLSPSQRINIIGPEICKEFGPFDFVFIDGLHYEEVVFSDLDLAAQHLVPSGSIALHDVLGAWGSNVRRAVYRFLDNHEDFLFSHDSYSAIYNSIGLLERAPKSQSIFARGNNLDLKSKGLIQNGIISNLATILLAMFSPSSVIQIGSNFDLLEQMRKYGVPEVFALAIAAPEGQSYFNQMELFNFREKYNFRQRYDLCICLDIADSFAPELFDNAIQACVDASDTVLFACTPPGEIGSCQHNDKVLSYWVKRFYEKGYIFHDEIRPVLEPITFLDVILPEYVLQSTYLLNLYLLRKERRLGADIQGNIKKYIENIILKKENRIEDLILQNLYQTNIILDYKKTLKFKEEECKRYLEEIRALKQNGCDGGKSEKVGSLFKRQVGKIWQIFERKKI